MNEKKNSKSGGFGLAGILTIVFVILKLTNVISWSWVWVLSPLWIGFAVAIAFLVLYILGSVVFVGGADLLDKMVKNRR